MLQTATITKQETKEKPYRILFDVRSRSYQQWLECRQHFITGSDAGSLAHINKYCSARKTYMLKKGLLEKEKETEQMKFGRLLEPIIRNEYRRITGYEVREIPYMLASTRYEWMAGNIDGAVLLPSKDGTKEWAVLEIKNLGFYTSSTEYAGGEPGYISPSHLAQLYHYMLLTGLRMSVLVTLQCGSKLTWQIVEFDDDTGDSLLALS